MNIFDKNIQRRGTDCVKYDFTDRHKMPLDILPMWVADMDFKVPQCVTDELEKLVKHGIYGYTDTGEDYYNALSGWFKSGFGYDIMPDAVVKTPGVVYAVNCAVRALTRSGDSVLIQTPVYYPFYNAVTNNRRKLVENPLAYSDNYFTIDFDDFERKIVQNNVKMFILCSPHNPVSRVWTYSELHNMAQICLKHNVIIISDEIHMDFALFNNKHTITASINKDIENITVTCTAPSKTFNLAGLQASNIIITNSHLRKAFKQEMRAGGYSQPNTAGLAACRAAYAGGAQWLRELKEYLQNNITYTDIYLSTHLPQIKTTPTQGTYLKWLDFNELKLPHNEISSILINKAKLWLSDGTVFGQGAKGFFRINLACPLTTVKTALANLKAAFGK